MVKHTKQEEIGIWKYIEGNGKSLLFPRGRLGRKVGVFGQRPIFAGCPFRFLSAQKERPITSHPIFWTLCPEAEASLMVTI